MDDELQSIINKFLLERHCPSIDNVIVSGDIHYPTTQRITLTGFLYGAMEDWEYVQEQSINRFTSEKPIDSSPRMPIKIMSSLLMNDFLEMVFKLKTKILRLNSNPIQVVY